MPRVLKSVKGLADEIIVVDMESEDATTSVAKKAGAKVFNHKKTGYVEPARNFAISKATCDWILILDADEEVGESLKKKLKGLASGNSSADFYRLPRKNIIFNKWIQNSLWWPDYNIRFFKKGKVAWSEIIHSVPETQGRGEDLQDKEELAIIHHHYETVEQYVQRLNNYTTEHAKLLTKDGYKFSWQDLIKKPTSEFLSRYFFGGGYRDGIHGLALVGLQAFSELVLHLKVWQYEKFKEESVALPEVIQTMRGIESDLHYWQADTLYKEQGSLVQRVKRRFKLP